MTESELIGLRKLGATPFTTAQIAALYPRVKALEKKTAKLISDGFIIRLCRDRFCLTQGFTGSVPDREVAANVICAPSYVTAESALMHYGLIPERVTRVQSARLGRSTSFETPIGGFDYHSMPADAYSIGQTTECSEEGNDFLCASPVKAIYDIIQLRRNLGIRSRRDMRAFLAEDLRIETSDWRQFDRIVLDELIGIGHKRLVLQLLKEVLDDTV